MLQDYDGTVVVEKGGVLDIEKWKAETKDVCHQCSVRLQNKDAIFKLAEQQIKNSKQLNRFKDQYEQFIDQMKSKFDNDDEDETDNDSDTESENDNNNDYESDSDLKRTSKKRKYVENYPKFSQGNGSPQLHRVYDKFESSNKGFWQNLIVAFKGGDVY